MRFVFENLDSVDIDDKYLKKVIITGVTENYIVTSNCNLNYLEAHSIHITIDKDANSLFYDFQDISEAFKENSRMLFERLAEKDLVSISYKDKIFHCPYVEESDSTKNSLHKTRIKDDDLILSVSRS